MPPLTNRKPTVHILRQHEMMGFTAVCGRFCGESDKSNLQARKGRPATCTPCKLIDKKNRAIRAGKAYGYAMSPGTGIKYINRR
jgi:hypothetical protein